MNGTTFSYSLSSLSVLDQVVRPSAQALKNTITSTTETSRQISTAIDFQVRATANALSVFGSDSPEYTTESGKLVSLENSLATARNTLANAQDQLTNSLRQEPTNASSPTLYALRNSMIANRPGARTPISTSTGRNRNPERFPPPVLLTDRSRSDVDRLDRLAAQRRSVSGKFFVNYKDNAGANKVFSFALLPAIESSFSYSGGQSPGVKSGIMISSTRNVKKFRIPGWEPIYQSLGGDQKNIVLVGAFIGGESIDNKEYVTGELNEFLINGGRRQKNSSYEASSDFVRRVIDNGRSTELVIDAVGDENDVPFIIRLRCLFTSIEMYAVRGDRTYYAISAIITNYPKPKAAAPAAALPTAPTTRLGDTTRTAGPNNAQPPVPDVATPKAKSTTVLTPKAAPAPRRPTPTPSPSLSPSASPLPTLQPNASPSPSPTSVFNKSSFTVPIRSEEEMKKYKEATQERTKAKTRIRNYESERERIVEELSKKPLEPTRNNIRNFYPDFDKQTEQYLRDRELVNSKINISFLPTFSQPIASVIPFDTDVASWAADNPDFRISEGTGPGAAAYLPDGWDVAAASMSADSAPTWTGELGLLSQAGSVVSPDTQSSVTPELIPLNNIIASSATTTYYAPDLEKAVIVQGYIWYEDGSIEAPNGVRYIPSVGVVNLDDKIVLADQALPSPPPVLYPVRSVG